VDFFTVLGVLFIVCSLILAGLGVYLMAEKDKKFEELNAIFIPAALVFGFGAYLLKDLW
jgi:apolipoprotein N-acyltransferase